MVVSSELYLNFPEADPIKLVRPVLSDIDPVNNFAVPPVPVVKTGEPEIIIFPEDVLPVPPTLADEPAFKTIELDPVFPVVILSPKVKFPEVVEALNVESDVVAPTLPPDNVKASDVVTVRACELALVPLIILEIVCCPPVLLIVEVAAKVIAPL